MGIENNSTKKPTAKQIAFNIVCFFMPPVGIIYYFVKRKEKPEVAKKVLKNAIIGCFIGLIMGLIFDWILSFWDLSIFKLIMIVLKSIFKF